MNFYFAPALYSTSAMNPPLPGTITATTYSGINTGTTRLQAVSATGGQIVWVGANGTTNAAGATTADGITYVGYLASAPVIRNGLGVAYGLGRWVITGANAATTTIRTSTDNLTWTVSNPLPSSTWARIVFDGTAFLITNSTSGSTTAYRSLNGTTWSAVTTPGGNFLPCANDPALGGAGGQIVMIGLQYGTIADLLVSNDSGATWTTYSLVPAIRAFRIQQISYANGMYIGWSIRDSAGTLTTTHFTRSTDGVNWQNADSGIAAQTWGNIAYGGGYYVLLGGFDANNTGLPATNIGLYSTDGITWTQFAMPFAAYWGPLSYINGRFCVVETIFSGSLSRAVSFTIA